MTKDVSKLRKFIDLNELQFKTILFISPILLELKSERSFFLLAKGKYAIVWETRFDDIYEKYADKGDGFLYIFYVQETFWGGT